LQDGCSFFSFNGPAVNFQFYICHRDLTTLWFRADFLLLRIVAEWCTPALWQLPKTSQDKP
jgi:hypothetical protein